MMKQLTKNQLIIIIFLISGVLLTSGLLFFNLPKQQTKTANKPKIVATFFPLYSWTKSIVGDKFEVINLAGNNEPHDFEPTSKDLTQINSSKLLISHSTNFDKWLNKLEPEILASNVKILKTAEKLDLREVSDGETNSTDPHFWLDPVLTKEAVLEINQKVQQIDQDNKNFYQDNTNILLSGLENVDREFQKDLKTCKNKNIITIHEAFNYLGARYGINFESVVGVNPESELTFKDYQKINDFATEKNIKYVLVESNIADKMKEALGGNLNLQVLPISTLETLTNEEVDSGVTYLEIMHKNINTLKIAMDCQN